MILPEMDDARAYRAIPSDPDAVEEDDTSRCRWGPNPRHLVATLSLLVVEWLLICWVVHLGEAPRYYLIFASMYAFAMGVVILVNRSNPGFVPKDTDLELYRREALPATTVELNHTRFVQRWCVSCRMYKRPRVKHCYECRRCVSRFDHHCPWMSNCIGANNYKLFLLFWQHYLGLQIYSLYFIGQCISAKSADTDVSLLGAAVRSVASEHPLLVCILVVTCIRLLLAGCVFAAHGYLVCRNMTHYEYRSQPYKGNNPFDLGRCGLHRENVAIGLYQNLRAFVLLPWIDFSRD
ncbi:Probable S-acyltransferase or Palmitoyltransferase [Babesia bigemina]|uniref:Palmitoyltransferase n=1 Tax=Babesia bigemina TaxID=5866 RepID=A0A061D7J0_BABBI|nr:Probable S-acyltransferase or Palmitoyltransferase [Babesia bigemina]CDR95952.1 Probable S-acyltransferase or Palmitoyltransferase [Babesia bigemina]|eukprot:XP_012768138.1 Probable S-acyltransferase or Palmitoyltransferase [Babesia bigemina]